MRAVYDLPQSLLQKVLKTSKAKSKKEAIIIALEMYLKRYDLEKFAQKFGAFDLDWTHKKLEQFRKDK